MLMRIFTWRYEKLVVTDHPYINQCIRTSMPTPLTPPFFFAFWVAAWTHLEPTFGSTPRPLNSWLRLLYWSQFRLHRHVIRTPLLTVLRFASQLDMNVYEKSESGFGVALPLVILDMTRASYWCIAFRDHRLSALPEITEFEVVHDTSRVQYLPTSFRYKAIKHYTDFRDRSLEF
jgi:hypothetical protein